MADVNFFDPATGNSLNGSGIGFYGAGFSSSVNVGLYQTTTFITNSNGTLQGANLNNVKYQNTHSGIVGSATSGIWLTQIPNYQSTLNIRFTHSSNVNVQNCKVYIYDRSNINNDASGVTTKAAEIIHPGLLQSDNTGSGDTQWITPNGSGQTITMAVSPGMSGLYAGNGSNGGASSNRHDWYLALSASPDSIGSKLFGLYFSCEYI